MRFAVGMRTFLLALGAITAGCVAETPEPTGTGRLAINEVAPRGEPTDWFEVVNAGDAPIELSDFIFIDRQVDFTRAKRFPEMTLAPGQRHVQVVTRDLHGFQLGASEALFVYRYEDRVLVDRVTWKKGSAPLHGSYARVPDATGRFASTRTPTPGAAN